MFQIRSLSLSSRRAGRVSPGRGMSIRSSTTKASRPNTRRIGWLKLSPLYCVVGAGSGKPQSQAGARRSAPEAKRWMTVDAIVADMTMKIATSRPLYELRLAATGAIDSQAVED